MLRKASSGVAKATRSSGANIPQDDWSRFLDTFSRRHHGWLVQLDTHDRVTGEDVVSRETPLRSIEFDLEDEAHPRINVTVQLGNKVIKHILFMPSRLALQPPGKGEATALRVETVNTTTTLRFREPAPGT